MSRIINTIEGLKKLLHLTPAEIEDVLRAQIELGLTFADEYKDYVLTYGVITAKGVEITGVCESKRLNVTDVTKKEREYNPDMPKNMYVIDSTGMEGLLILQDESGAIYSFSSEDGTKKIFGSLADYLVSLQAE